MAQDQGCLFVFVGLGDFLFVVREREREREALELPVALCSASSVWRMVIRTENNCWCKRWNQQSRILKSI